jgi:ATP-dependent Clp protease ATP-binding subunit ClpA
LFLISLTAVDVHAQESEQVYIKGRRYLDINIHVLDKYAGRLERTQKHLLNKLKRKERKLARQLLHKDSIAYARFKANPLTYDSISKLAANRPDSSTFASRAGRVGNKSLDTLKGAESLLCFQFRSTNIIMAILKFSIRHSNIGKTTLNVQARHTNFGNVPLKAQSSSSNSGITIPKLQVRHFHIYPPTLNIQTRHSNFDIMFLKSY